MKYENILLERDNEILQIIINRPAKLNALNKQTLAELHTALIDAIENSSVGGMVITGSGEKAFVAGADISEFANYSSTDGKALAKHGHEKVFNLIANSPKPIIAAINGFALGGGLELALACHIRFASVNAKMGLPEVTLGLIPGYGGTQRLAQIVGKGRALEMILSANMINSSEAFRIGLVNKVFDQADLLTETTNFLNIILSRSPKAITAAIAAINASDGNTKEGFNKEIEEFGKCFANTDFTEGVSAFLEKRKPIFKK